MIRPFRAGTVPNGYSDHSALVVVRACNHAGKYLMLGAGPVIASLMPVGALRVALAGL